MQATQTEQSYIYETILSLEDALTQITESLESIDESLEFFNDYNPNVVYVIKETRNNLEKEQANLEELIEHLTEEYNSMA